ncbi:MAG: hypothetical protein P4K93_01915 [Terracidiphilus sp.]|nr:hypothetical protein [Terracidiphilus sp.]MDR3796877.1 hypothetical protein [Terracidiphilus sp.]
MEVSLSKESETPALDECWALLQRIGASPGLRRAPRLREFLDYVARRSLRDGCNQIHEQEIGIAVFGRLESYDTSVDNIVRANATELRKRIEAYFESEGSREPLIVEIPRGSYIPVFRHRPVVVESLESGFAGTASAEASEARPAVRRALFWLPWVIAGLVVAALSACCISLWMQNRAINKSLYPWKDEPTVSSLWSQFIDANRGTDIVIADQSFLLLQNIDKQVFSFNEYLNRSYINHMQTTNLSPDMRGVLNLIASKNIGSLGEFRLGQRILALDPQGKNIHLYGAREYMPPLLSRDNVILIGGPISNPWQQLFASRMNFVIEPDSNRYNPIHNRAPAPGEQTVYSTDADPLGYCIVAFLPSPDHNGKVLIIEGTSAEATEAGGDFLLSENQLSSFQKRLHAASFPYFEVLLKTAQASDTPFSTFVTAYRTYPDLH